MYDVCIIGGGGVVGCAIARELAQRGRSVVALEKHDGLCKETSGLNSRVIHSGFHETAGTLKAALAREGSRRIIEYAEERAVPLLKTGMLIAVPHGGISGGLWKEGGSLWNLWKGGKRQNVPFRFVFSPSRVYRIAPIRALAGIFIPSVCVIDVEAFSEALSQDAKAAGAVFQYGSEVARIIVNGSQYRIITTTGEFTARAVVNAAGLHAHHVSKMAGGPAYDVEFVRGDYYELLGGIEKWKIRTLVYPAVPPGSRSKGVHFGPRTDGKLYIGPSATDVENPAPKEVFVEAARRFLPDVRESDLQWAYCGMRPKHGLDFRISVDRKSPPLVNLIGIDSPGLSSSMAIARYVFDMMTKPFVP